MNPFIVFRTSMCPKCRLAGYGVLNGYLPENAFKPCAECELVIEKILEGEDVPESKL
jgi:hypothetical protein